jgi:hypothetical protein
MMLKSEPPEHRLISGNSLRDILLPRKTLIIRAVPRTPEYLGRDDEIRAAQIELLEYAAPAERPLFTAGN